MLYECYMKEKNEFVSYKIKNIPDRYNKMREIPWNESKYIVASSSLFLLPAYSFYCCNQIALCTGLCITSLVSMNFWRDARRDSWRRQLDLTVAKIAFGTYFSTGTWNIRTAQDCQRVIPVTMVIAGCYYLSDKLSRTEILDKIQPQYWILAHAMFHCMLTTNLFHVVELVCSCK